jgi:AsmA-like C-terminal region
MNATAIYSKSGKGVQEASGKTSHLPRSDRAVLAAIDGRATLADVAQKVGKPFDAAFEKLIESLDKGGFIREVSAGSAGVVPKPGAGKSAAKPAASPMDASADLDFTTALSQPKVKAAPPPPPPQSAEEKAKAERIAREQQEAVFRAREEAERKAAAERERVKAEAEAKMRAEQESRLRAEADAKIKAEAEAKARAAADAKVKAAQEAAAKAAAEAKAKAEAEAKKVREEAERARKEAEEKAERARNEAERARKEAEEKAERARKEAEEKAERARKEAEDKARREQAELMRKLEEERKAREEAERKAQEEAKRVEEERRKLEEERVSRRIQEERERAERRRYQQEEEERAAKRRPKEEEQPFPELKLNEPVAQPPPPPEPATSGAGVGFSDTLLADLESFTTREEQVHKENEEAARKEKEAAAARAREAEERRAREDAERQEREAREQRKREEAERKAREAAELREREERERERLREEEDRRKREAEERAKKAKQEERQAARAERGPVFVEEAKARSRRERELAAKPRSGAQAARKSWGKPIAVTLFGLLAVAVAVAHVMPIDTADYERAATDALGRPVRIGSARLSFITGLQLKLSDVRMGDTVHIPEVRAYPELSALFGPRKTFERIEIEGARLDQAALGQALFAGIKADNFNVSRVTARGLELTGPLALPKGLEFEAAYDRDGALRTASVRGADALLVKLSRKGQGFEAEMSAATLALPFAPEITLGKFSARGVATPQGMSVSEWDGSLLNGTVSGTATLRWGESWSVDGVLTARNLYAAVFAPALISDGKAEGSGKFQMRGAPGKLASSARLDGSFTVTRGVLGSIDLSRAIQTNGKFATGRTEFSEMNGQATYDRGAVALRNITLGAGQLNAGASADISQSGALSGRIIADVRVASQTLRATLNLGGTLKEPQVRN